MLNAVSPSSIVFESQHIKTLEYESMAEASRMVVPHEKKGIGSTVCNIYRNKNVNKNCQMEQKFVTEKALFLLMSSFLFH